MQRSNKSGNNNTVTLDQAEAVMKDAPNYLDGKRGQSLATLGSIKRAKVVQSRRERARAEVRFGEDHVRVQQADLRMRQQHHQLVNTRVEADRSQLKTFPDRDGKRWVLHGFVRTQEGTPIAKAKVSLYADRDGYEKEVAQTVSDSKGYYTLSWPPTDKKAKPIKSARMDAYADAFSGKDLTDAQRKEIIEKHRRESGADAVEVNTAFMIKAASRVVKQPVFLGADHAGKKRMDGRSLYPSPGGIVYRDIELDLEDSTHCQLRTRYLGNSNTRELHDLSNEKTGCRIASIRPDHRVYFVSEQQAKDLGYDFCAHCFGKAKSKR